MTQNFGWGGLTHRTNQVGAHLGPKWEVSGRQRVGELAVCAS